jgi:hypothetical protein
VAKLRNDKFCIDTLVREEIREIEGAGRLSGPSTAVAHPLGRAEPGGPRLDVATKGISRLFEGHEKGLLIFDSLSASPQHSARSRVRWLEMKRFQRKGHAIVMIHRANRGLSIR